MNSSKTFQKKLLILLFLTITIAGLYIVNINFYPINGDSTIITKMIEAVESSGSINPKIGPVYSNGYIYQIFAVICSLLCGLKIIEFQYLLRPFFIIIPIYISYLLFSSFFKDRKVILISMFLLFVSPITLFSIIESKHGFMVMSFLFLLVFLVLKFQKILKKQYVFLILIILIAIDGTNIYMANVINICLTFICFLILFKYHLISNNNSKQIRLTLIIWIISLLVMVYLYPRMFDGIIYIIKQIYHSNPSTYMTIPQTYSYVDMAWKNPLIYWLVIALYNITILPLSLLIFVYLFFSYFSQSIIYKFKELAIIGIFGILGAIISFTIIIDAAGAYGLGANFQLRTTFLIIPFSILLIGIYIGKKPQGIICKLIKSPIFFIFLGICLIGSYIYITADPNFSNSWRFFNTYEKNSIFWLDNNIDQSVLVWEGDAFVTGSRLADIYQLFRSNISKKKIYFHKFSENLDFFILSNIIFNHYEDLSQKIPDLNKFGIIFSNGNTDIFHKY